MVPGGRIRGRLAGPQHNYSYRDCSYRIGALMATATKAGSIEQYLGAAAESLLGFSNPRISKERLHLPGPDFVDRVVALSNRTPRVLANLQRLFQHGRLSGTGYMSILPVDQGIEHSGGASFAKNPDYFDAENMVKLAR